VALLRRSAFISVNQRQKVWLLPMACNLWPVTCPQCFPKRRRRETIVAQAETGLGSCLEAWNSQQQDRPEPQRGDTLFLPVIHEYPAIENFKCGHASQPDFSRADPADFLEARFGPLTALQPGVV
jgi:hypothetical protein